MKGTEYTEGQTMQTASACICSAIHGTTEFSGTSQNVFSCIWQESYKRKNDFQLIAFIEQLLQCNDYVPEG